MMQPGQLQRWGVGEALKSAKLNEPVDVLNRLRGVGTANQFIGHPIPEGGAGGAVELFRVMNEREFPEGEHAMQNDYFYAEHVSTGETKIKVAKPWKLRTTPWHDTTEWLTEFDVEVTYIYPHRLFEPLNFNYRWATREDEPNIRAVQIIWPAYGTDPHIFTATDFVWAAFVGEEATKIDGVDWQDMNVDSRVWSLFPAAFQAQR